MPRSYSRLAAHLLAFALGRVGLTNPQVGTPWGHGALRNRKGLLLTGIIAIASVVAISCEIPRDYGVEYAGLQEDGTVIATIGQTVRSMQPVESLTRSDGGLTWSNVDDLYWDVGTKSAETPSGRYVIQDQGVAWIGSEGGSEMAYSTVYFQQDSNMWVRGSSRTDESRSATTSSASPTVHASSWSTWVRRGRHRPGRSSRSRWRGTWPNSPQAERGARLRIGEGNHPGRESVLMSWGTFAVPSGRRSCRSQVRS